MNQLIYLLIIFLVSFGLSSIYMWGIKIYKILKLIYVILAALIFSYVCYLFNYFIFNEYVVLTILYGIYISYIVKNRVKKLLKNRT